MLCRRPEPQSRLPGFRCTACRGVQQRRPRRLALASVGGVQRDEEGRPSGPVSTLSLWWTGSGGVDISGRTARVSISSEPMTEELSAQFDLMQQINIREHVPADQGGALRVPQKSPNAARADHRRR